MVFGDGPLGISGLDAVTRVGPYDRIGAPPGELESLLDALSLHLY